MTVADGETIIVKGEDNIVVDGVAAPEDTQQGPVVPDGDTEADLKAPSDVGRSKREATSDGKHKKEDVHYVSDTPRVKDGNLQLATVVKDGDGEPLLF